MGSEDDSELPDERDFPDARHDDIAEYIETGDNNTAIEKEMHGNLQTTDDDHYNNSPHTTTIRNSVEQPQQTLPQDTAKTTRVERPLDPKKVKKRKQLPCSLLGTRYTS